MIAGKLGLFEYAGQMVGLTPTTKEMRLKQ